MKIIIQIWWKNYKMWVLDQSRLESDANSYPRFKSSVFCSRWFKVPIMKAVTIPLVEDWLLYGCIRE